MAVGQALVDAAVSTVEYRLAGESWAGDAAMRLADGSVLTSTAPHAANPAVETCHETGVICEGWKLNQRIVDSVCVTQPHHRSPRRPARPGRNRARRQAS